MRLLSGGDDGVGQGPFLRLEFEHLFLDRISRDEPVGKDRPSLADPVGAVDRLAFHRGIPPGVEQEDVVCRRQGN